MSPRLRTCLKRAVAATLGTVILVAVAWFTTGAGPQTLAHTESNEGEFELALTDIDGCRVRLVRESATGRLWAYLDDECWTSDSTIPFTSKQAAERIAEVVWEPIETPSWVQVTTTTARETDTPTVIRISRQGVADVVRRLQRTQQDRLVVTTPLKLLQGGPQTWTWYYVQKGLSRDDFIRHEISFVRRRAFAPTTGPRADASATP